MAGAGVVGVGSSRADLARVREAKGVVERAKASTAVCAAASTIGKGDKTIGASLACVSIRAFSTSRAELASVLVGVGLGTALADAALG